MKSDKYEGKSAWRNAAYTCPLMLYTAPGYIATIYFHDARVHVFTPSNNRTHADLRQQVCICDKWREFPFFSFYLLLVALPSRLPEWAGVRICKN